MNMVSDTLFYNFGPFMYFVKVFVEKSALTNLADYETIK